MRKQPKVFVDSLANSCWFSGPGPARDLASRNGIKFEADSSEADVLASDRMSRLRRLALRHPGKKLLLWTQEPRYDTNTSPEILLFGFLKRVRVMNVYTGDVFMSNTGVWGHRIGSKISSDDALSHYRKKQKAGVAVATYQEKSPDLLINGVNVDLQKTRQNLALKMNRLGACDIFGRHWPAGVSISESREGDWKGSKNKILHPYRFNVCLENTAYPFYCTEKIWDSIRNFCIPIYTSEHNRIYSNFDTDSFVDASLFKDAGEIADYILGLSDSDAARRLVRCVEAYNAAFCERFEQKPNTAEDVVHRFSEVVRDL